VGPKELIELPIFWHLSSCFVTTTVGGMYLAGTFKTFGQESIKSEAFLSMVTSMSSIFNAGGRIMWGSLADRIGPLRTLLLLSLLFSLIIATYSLAPLLFGQTGFAAWTFLVFLFEGGNFVLYVPLTVQLFGARHSASNYGLLFSTYTVFVVLNITVLSDLALSFPTASRLMAGLTFIGFINLLFLDKHIKGIKVKKQDNDFHFQNCKLT
jgi:OFA family oxalate/formate antiporter-like MFS transporter